MMVVVERLMMVVVVEKVVLGGGRGFRLIWGYGSWGDDDGGGWRWPLVRDEMMVRWSSGEEV